MKVHSYMALFFYRSSRYYITVLRDLSGEYPLMSLLSTPSDKSTTYSSVLQESRTLVSYPPLFPFSVLDVSNFPCHLYFPTLSYKTSNTLFLRAPT